MKLLKTATVCAIVIVLLTALAACGYVEEPVNNPSAAEKIIYTDYHMHLMSKPMADIFIELIESDKVGEYLSIK
jgi:hypothetical protein